jgi:putative spermidine/putrescine transport system permease protein
VVYRRATALAVASPPYAWLGLFLVVPLIFTLALSFRADMQGELLGFWRPTLKQYQTIFAVASYWQTLAFSIAVAFGVAVSTIALAYPVAYFLVFRAGRAAGLCLLLLLIPFWTSFLLRVMSWMRLLDSDGPVNWLVIHLRVIGKVNWLLIHLGAIVNWLFIHLGVITEPIDDLDAFLYSPAALVITLIYVWIPFAALPIAAALRGIDAELVEAALDLGASPWRCFRTITFPLSLPGVLAAFFLVFIPTVGEYVTPMLVGGPDSYMYGNIIQQIFDEAGNLAQCAALSVVMLVVTLLLVALAARLANLKAVRMTQRQAAISARGRSPLLTGYFAGLIALLYLPLAYLFLLSFAGAHLSFPFQDLTLASYESLFQPRETETGQSALNSLIVAVVSSSGATAFGTALALLHMRFNFRGDKFLFLLAMLPLVVPAVVLGVALSLMFNAARIDLSLWTVAIAHTVVALPYVILIVSAGLAGFDPDLEEAAMDLGAPYWRVIFNIVLPLIVPSILSAWLVAFTVSLDEVVLAQFLAGTDYTFPVYLLGQLRNVSRNRLPVMIACAVLMMIGTLLLVLSAEWIRRRGQHSPVDLHVKR